MIFEEAKRLIGNVAALETKALLCKIEIAEYAGLEQEFLDSEGNDKIYHEACERIFSKYLPDAKHEDAYIGEHDKTPVGFDEIRRLYEDWDIDTDFEAFFETWERAD